MYYGVCLSQHKELACDKGNLVSAMHSVILTKCLFCHTTKFAEVLLYGAQTMVIKLM